MNTIDIIKLQFYFLVLKCGRGADFQVNEIIPEAKLRRLATPASGATEIKLIVFRKGGECYLLVSCPKIYPQVTALALPTLFHIQILPICLGFGLCVVLPD
jgi:hypothetical protein